jgi:hypothetical protein
VLVLRSRVLFRIPPPSLAQATRALPIGCTSVAKAQQRGRKHIEGLIENHNVNKKASIPPLGGAGQCQFAR